jgi:Leucine-rich repeat (LRR) protein
VPGPVPSIWGCSGSKSFQPNLFALTHLRSLKLGYRYFDEAGSRLEDDSDIAPNRLDSLLPRLAALADLVELSVAGAELTTLAGISELQALQSLDCSHTQVEDLAPVGRAECIAIPRLLTYAGR